ncbi:MAG TPA: YjgP/YjgQ family permease [Candidatus Marinimicrobia bacterium]|nr:YjgP/YjgQ family permease [Candidatus Neomarinimicrobiota bacterium]
MFYEVKRLPRKILAFCGAWIGARYIYRELIFPFLFAISVVTFVLLSNFLFKSVDRLLGKGLQLSVIFEFLYLNLAWIVAMSVPMAVLVAALMAYGRLAEDNEITAMRSSGISFTTILGPGLIFGTLVCLFMIYFHNYVLPEFNHKARLLAGDIYRKRPGLNIEPGYFMDDIPDYSIYVKEREGDQLRKLTIYNKDSQSTQTTIYADSGYLEVDGNTVLFMLFSGEIHELDLENLEDYRKTDFKRHRIAIPVDNLMLERRESARRGDREMTIAMMQENVRKYTRERDKVYAKIFKLVERDLDSTASIDFNKIKALIEQKKTENVRNLAEKTAVSQNKRLNALMSRIKGELNLATSYQKQINKYKVEIHKKFSIPVACIIFILIGAPMGVITKKGGIAVPALLSLLFFLLYYVFLVGGEELADLLIVSPFWAMWTPNILLLIAGIYLTYYATWEHRMLNIEHIKKWFKQKKRNHTFPEES